MLHTARVPAGSYNVAQGGGWAFTPSLSQGTLCLLDARGRVLRRSPGRARRARRLLRPRALTLYPAAVRRVLIIIVLVLGAVLVPAAQADRPKPLVRVPTSGKVGFGALAVRGDGALAVAWTQRRGTADVRLARRIGTRWTVSTVQRRAPVRSLAVTHDRARPPRRGLGRRRGRVRLPRRPRRVGREGQGHGSRGHDAAQRAFAVAAILRQGPTDRLRVFTGRPGAWRAHDLGAVRRWPQPTLDAAPYGAGYALTFGDRRKGLVVSLHGNANAGGTRLPLRTPATGIARIAASANGSLQVLHGGGGHLGYAVVRGGKIAERQTLLSNLPCDATGNVVGIASPRRGVRFAFGVGCDIGWELASPQGRFGAQPSMPYGGDPALALEGAGATLAALVLRPGGLAVRPFAAS